MTTTLDVERAINLKTFSNWAHIHSWTPTYYHQPTTEQEIVNIVKYALAHGEKVKVVGSAHSPTDIVCTDGHTINLDKYNRILSVDKANHRVKVQAGIRLYQLNNQLPEHGLALPNLGSISDQSIAGAISTGTHGTGLGYGCLSTFIVDMELITGTGDIIYLSEQHNHDVFKAAQCSLGALGIISTLTIQCVPDFDLVAVKRPMKLPDVLRNLEKLTKSAEFWRFWWFPHTDYCIVWGANKVTNPEGGSTNVPPPEETRNDYITTPNNDTDDDDTDSVAEAAQQLQAAVLNSTSTSSLSSSSSSSSWSRAKAHFKERILGYHIYESLLYAGSHVPAMVPFINRAFRLMLHNEVQVSIDKGYKILNFDCLFKQYVNEWAIPKERTALALIRLKHLIEKNNFKVHFPVEVRFAQKDDVWASPGYEVDTCWIGIIMYRPYGKDVPFVKQYFTEFEKIMLSMGGRPHWAKEFFVRDRDFQKMYPKWAEFKKVRDQCDPHRVFANPYLERVMGK